MNQVEVKNLRNRSKIVSKFEIMKLGLIVVLIRGAMGKRHAKLRMGRQGTAAIGKRIPCARRERSDYKIMKKLPVGEVKP